MWPFRGDNSKALLREKQRTNQVDAKVSHKRKKWLRIAFQSATETLIDDKPYNVRWL